MNSHFLVVLPFANATGSREQDYLPSALTQTLTSKLSRTEDGSLVISYATARALPTSSTELQASLQKLGVHFALRGWASKATNHVLVETQLVAVETGQALWQEKFERPFGELPALEDQIVAMVAAQTHATLRETGRGPSNSVDPDALDKTLRAQALLQGPQSRERMADARILLRQALTEEPSFKDAMLSLASIDLAEALAQTTTSISSLLRECEDLLKKVLADEPSNDAALSLLGSLLRATNRGDEAVAAFEAAATTNPNNSNALAQLARAKIDVNSASEALPLIERALLISPLDPQRPLWFTYAGLALLYGHDPEAARIWLEKAVQVAPRFVNGYVLLASAQELSGDHAGAKDTMSAAKNLASNLSIARLDRQLKPTNHDALSAWHSILSGMERAGLGH